MFRERPTMRASARRLTVVGSSSHIAPLSASHWPQTINTESVSRRGGRSLPEPPAGPSQARYAVRGNWQPLLPVHPPTTYVDQSCVSLSRKARQDLLLLSVGPEPVCCPVCSNRRLAWQPPPMKLPPSNAARHRHDCPGSASIQTLSL